MLYLKYQKMSNKTTWTIIAVVVVVLILAGIVYWRLSAPDSEEQSEQAAQNLEQAAEQANQAVQVDIPSVNPLDAALPDVNPLEAANPFRTKNPFE